MRSKNKYGFIVICILTFIFMMGLITTVSAKETYSVSFIEQSGIVPTVTVYSNSDRTTIVDSSSLNANTTYYYTATNKGCENYDGAFRIKTEDVTIYFTMTRKTKAGNVTVNCVDAEGNILKKEAFSMDKYYDGDIYYYKTVERLNYNNKYYFVDNNFDMMPITLTAEQQEINILYNETDDNVIFYKLWKGMYTTNPYDLGYVQPGKYRFEASVENVFDDSSIFSNKIKVVNSSNNMMCKIFLSEKKFYSEEFTVDSATSLKLTSYNKSRVIFCGLNYVALVKTGDYDLPFIKGTVSASCVKDYTGELGNASVWTATFDNNTGYTVNAVSADAITQNGRYKESRDISIPAVTSGTVTIAVAINKSKAELADVSVSFK